MVQVNGTGQTPKSLPATPAPKTETAEAPSLKTEVTKVESAIKEPVAQEAPDNFDKAAPKAELAQGEKPVQDIPAPHQKVPAKPSPSGKRVPPPAPAKASKAE